ncbi:MAG: HlyD family efflux transporter periplasmic adaptor subunit [Succiniclasticum sp.]|jgi:HlyD family secretion protein|nr:HlyD family efflux transporter periplasmic adaptor subunit [Succiniclasticum sp.]
MTLSTLLFRTHKRIYLGVLALFLLFACLTAGCGKPAKQTVRLTGKVQLVRTEVKAPAAGKVQGLIVEKGERIRKGEPLFGIASADGKTDPGPKAKELAKAQAELHRAQSGNSAADRAAAAAAVQSALASLQAANNNYQKMSRLYGIGGVSKRQLDMAAQNQAAAQNNLAAAQARLAQAQSAPKQDPAALQEKVAKLKEAYEAEAERSGNEVKAPFTGLIDAAALKNGTAVQAGQTVLTLTATTECYIRIPHSSKDTRLEAGRTVTLSAPGLQKPFIGIIKENTDKELVIFSDQKPEDLPDGATVDIETTV